MEVIIKFPEEADKPYVPPVVLGKVPYYPIPRKKEHIYTKGKFWFVDKVVYDFELSIVEVWVKPFNTNKNLM